MLRRSQALVWALEVSTSSWVLLKGRALWSCDVVSLPVRAAAWSHRADGAIPALAASPRVRRDAGRMQARLPWAGLLHPSHPQLCAEV